MSISDHIKRSEEWACGHAARFEGVPFEENPYKWFRASSGGTGKRAKWEAGWMAADAEVTEAAKPDSLRQQEGLP